MSEEPRRPGRPRVDDAKVRLSTRVQSADRAALQRLASSRGTSLGALTGEILSRVAAKQGDRKP